MEADFQIDLKHYKSKRLALRWRTAPEVVDGIGEETCGSLRCKHHQPRSGGSVDGRDRYGSDNYSSGSSRGNGRPSAHGDRSAKRRKKKELQLRSYELPFGYEEAGERKEALVKVRLCKRCERKLTWKPDLPREDEGRRRPGSRRKEAESDSDSAGSSEKAWTRGGRGDAERRESKRDKERERDRRDNRRKGRSASPDRGSRTVG